MVCMVAVVLLVILPLTVSLLLHIPAVQNFAVQQLTHAASRKLETRVAVRRVDVRVPGKVRVDGFYVEDYQHDTLLYADRVEGFVTGLGFFGEGLRFGRAKISDAKLYLRETPEGVMNIKQVVNRLSNPNRRKKGKFRLSIHRAALDNMTLHIERLQHRNPIYGIDFGNMQISQIMARVNDLEIKGPNIAIDIQSLKAVERSGFKLDHLSGRFFLTNGCLGFENAILATERSFVSLPSFALAGESWAHYKNFISEVRIEGTVRNSKLASDDVAYFSPKLRDWHLMLSDLDLDMEGEVDRLVGRIRNVRVNGATSFVASATVRGLPNIRNTWFDLSMPRLTTTAPAADQLVQSIARRSLPKSVVKTLAHSGNVDFSLRFKGMLSDFEAQLDARTLSGSVDCDVAMKPLRGGLSHLRGEVATRDLRLGELLGRQDIFGCTTLNGSINGVIGRNYSDARIRGDIAQLGIKGYVYDSIRLDGRLRNKLFDGDVTTRDKNLDFDFSGMVDLNDSIPRYDFLLNLRHADLVRLRINRRDSVSQLVARMTARGNGRTIDDLNGKVLITDARYRYNSKTLQADSVLLRGVNSADSKYVVLQSDFADVTFRSRTSYQKVFDYLRQSAANYLPLLERPEGISSKRMENSTTVSDYSLLSVDIHRINPLIDAVSSGLLIADGSSMRLHFNPADNRLSFRASSDYVERKNMLATHLHINAANRGDSLEVYASAEDLYAGILHLPRFSVTGGARQGRMQLSAGFTDTVRHLSGLVGVQAALSEQLGINGRSVDVRILPSHLINGDQTWQIFSRRIQIDTSRIVVNRFRVINGQQELLLDGVASRRPSDSLHLTLRHFDLAPVSQLVDRMGYSISGKTDGQALMTAVLGGGKIDADIRVDSLAVNGIYGPPLQLVSRWDLTQKRAGLFVTNRNTHDTLIRGFYAPDTRRYYARMQVDSLNMRLLDPLLSGVISDTEGTAAADLTLQGQGRVADLSGRIHARNLRTMVDFTQVSYSMPEALIDVADNQFRTSNVPIFDAEGNRGRFDLDLNLSHLSNITYNVRVTPEKMLVLNTTEENNDAFYGKVYASGVADIKGAKGYVDMNITATTADRSSFYMPLSGKSNISNADWVTFKQPEVIDTSAVQLRKQIFERRRTRKGRASSRMNIGMNLDVKPNTDVELTIAGNTLQGRGEGQLNLQIKPRSNIFEMYGDYTISEGSFLFSLQNLINRKFVLKPGSTIQWTGSPVNALLDIEAGYKLKASLQPLLQGTSERISVDRSVPVECVIYLKDRLTAPNITFDVRVTSSDTETQAIIANALNTPETVDMQFLYLLLFKSFMADNSSSSQSVGASVSYNTGLQFLANQLSNLLSASDYNIVIRYRPKSELTSDEVDFGLSKSLINNRLFVEVEGNYLIDDKQTVNSSASNFMGEAYVTYLIDRAGALKLKAFTQTIDRFDENQGLQETGVGIYFKEDFNNFKDLRQRLKMRFTNKKRQARRAARRATADSLKRLEVDSIGTAVPNSK